MIGKPVEECESTIRSMQLMITSDPRLSCLHCRECSPNFHSGVPSFLPSFYSPWKFWPMMADPKIACNRQCWRGHKRAKEESVTVESKVQDSGLLQGNCPGNRAQSSTYLETGWGPLTLRPRVRLSKKGASISWKKPQLEAYHDFRESAKGKKAVGNVRDQRRQLLVFCDLKLPTL